MSVVTRQQEAAEAICSALYDMGYELLGETEGGRLTWFTRGHSPKNVRVCIDRSDVVNAVVVTNEWHNLSSGKRLRGSDRFMVACEFTISDADVKRASTEAAIHCLEVFKDVIEGKGCAGPAAIRKYAPGHLET